MGVKYNVCLLCFKRNAFKLKLFFFLDIFIMVFNFPGINYTTFVFRLYLEHFKNILHNKIFVLLYKEGNNFITY